MVEPSEAQLLRFISEKEPLEATLAAFPEVERARLVALLARLADTLEPRPGAAAPPPPALPAVEATAGLPAVRVYSDGAARGNPGPAGAGAVLLDANGRVVEKLGKFLGVQTNNFAEYMGLLIGLKRARELGAREVEVFADSELMIRQLGGQYKVKSSTLRPLFEEARKLLGDFTQVKLVHVRRELNAAADEMSNRAIDERM